ncbi:MAG: LysE family transporter [Flavobacteriales bacterium]|nr:LysE family transporter [Flavobacteriales bacterium]
MDVILQGILVGLVMSVGAGPVMFALIQTSLREGFWRAMIFEIGVILADASCITIAFFTFGRLLNNPLINNYILLAGGLVLIVLGVSNFKGKTARLRAAREFLRGKQTHGGLLIVQGFLYNLLNPSVILFWLGAVTLAAANFEGNRSLMIQHFSATLTTVFFFDTLKAFFAHTVRKFITPRFMMYSTQTMGVIFILFGTGLIIRSIISLINFYN